MTANHTATFADAAPTLIVGLGKTGLSCVRFLAGRGVPLAVTDSRPNPPGLDALRAEYAAVPVAVGGFDAGLFSWARRLVVSPGVSLREPLIVAAQARGIEILGDVEIFARLVTAPVVAITGSNGKSTVTTLLGEMLHDAGRSVLVGANLGTPALDLLLQPAVDCYVLELSSFQLETTASLHSAAAVVLNISADHMDRYDDLDAYAAAKQRVYQGGGVQVLNRDDARVMAMELPGRRHASFGLDPAEGGNFGRLFTNQEWWLAQGVTPLLAVSQLRIAGKHNQANALAALALGDAIGLPMTSMLGTLRRFGGLPHRTQWVAELNGVSWYNDSKGTNVGATVAAINGLSGPLLLIAGGQGKDADFTELRAAVASKVRAVILIGQDANKIAAAIGDITRVVYATSMADAVSQAQRLAEPGEAVLLSPACASFDMFNGYDHRGEVFMAAVRNLGSGGGA